MPRAPGRVFLPGPVAVDPEVLAAMLAPMASHRTPGMSARLAAMQPMLRALFRTDRPVLQVTASATGLMEASVQSAVRGPLLVVVGGLFGERWAMIAEQAGREVVRLPVPYERPVTPEELRAALRARPDVEAVALVHSETGTGVLAPLAELVATVRAESGALVLVDAVTSLGGSPVETAALDLDFCFTGSQKAMGLPPGLAFGVASDRLLSRARTFAARGFYLDLVTLHQCAERDVFPQTPALPIVHALEFQLRRLAVEGVEGRWRRHRLMRERIDRWSAETGWPLVAIEGARSWTVSAIAMPPGRSSRHVVAAMAERGYVLVDGLPPYEERHLRIGHMGDLSVDDLEPMLGTLDEVLSGRR